MIQNPATSKICVMQCNCVTMPVKLKMKGVATSCQGSKWVVSIALILIGLMIIAIVYQLVCPMHVLDVFESFEQTTSDLIYVYMDGCAHCQQFDPTWTEFTTTYKRALKDAGVKVKKLRNDDSAAKGLGHGYPTVVLISRSGDFAQTTFDGQRTVPGLVVFVSSSIPSFSV